jgi:pimeloyl-ACP methyl ester carboxylesterase
MGIPKSGSLGKILVLSLSALFVSALALAQRPFAIREFFYVGGKYVGPPGNQVMAGQMYVERLRPQKVTQKYPIVLIHSSGSATLWMGTPDGRPGWADYFLSQGYVVYLPDQPARGRSAWHGSVNSPLALSISESRNEQQDTAPELFGKWPGAKTHTQWPGDAATKGRRGDPTYDAFYATMLETLSDGGEAPKLFEAAGEALLDKIGPAIILTHSQTGPFGWAIGDGRPNAVKGIVAIEPTGPPFRNAIVNGGNENEVRPWGLTSIPLHYSPPLESPADLHPRREDAADGPGLANCWAQTDPPHQLTNLKGIPILIVTTESSYHAVYDHCTSKYLTRAGVTNTHMRLANEGLHGNAHYVMVEKNNLEVAAVLHKWITEHIK